MSSIEYWAGALTHRTSSQFMTNFEMNERCVYMCPSKATSRITNTEFQPQYLYPLKKIISAYVSARIFDTDMRIRRIVAESDSIRIRFCQGGN